MCLVGLPDFLHFALLLFPPRRAISQSHNWNAPTHSPPCHLPLLYLPRSLSKPCPALLTENEINDASNEARTSSLQSILTVYLQKKLPAYLQKKYFLLSWLSRKMLLGGCEFDQDYDKNLSKHLSKKFRICWWVDCSSNLQNISNYLEFGELPEMLHRNILSVHARANSPKMMFEFQWKNRDARRKLGAGAEPNADLICSSN